MSAIKAICFRERFGKICSWAVRMPGEDALWMALEQVKLADFLREAQGLDTRLAEKASNLSGGQCQRLALARALLHDSPGVPLR